MNEYLTVSIIIPCYNSEKYLERAILSALKQNYPVQEIIVVNNNSTDKSDQIISKLANLYPDKIKGLTETAKGANFARNEGLKVATGQWIQFLDADDEILDSKIREQIELIQEESSDLVIGDYVSVGPGAAKKKVVRCGIQNNPEEERIWGELVNSNLGYTCSILWKKEFLINISGWDTEISSSQEYDLLFRYLKLKPKISFSSGLETIKYVQENSISKTIDKVRLEQILSNNINLRLRIRDFLSKEGVLTENLNGKISFHIYLGLLMNSDIAPDFFRYEVSRFFFKVSLYTKVKLYIRYILSYSVNKSKYKRVPVVLFYIPYRFMKDLWKLKILLKSTKVEMGK